MAARSHTFPHRYGDCAEEAVLEALVCGSQKPLAVFLDPGISTTLFQIFQCKEYYNEKDSAQWWLWSYSAVECRTTQWWATVGVGILVILCFVIGFPLGLFCAMRSMRRYRKIRLSLKSVRLHADKVTAREWLPATCRAAYLLRDLLDAKPKRSLRFLIDQQTSESPTAPDKTGNWDTEPNTETANWDDMSKGAQDQQSPGAGGVVEAAAEEDRDVGTIEMYALEGSFTEEDPCANGNSEENAGQPESGAELLALPWEKAREVVALVEGDRVRMALFSKVAVVHGKEGVLVPETRLDGPEMSAIFLQFFGPFEDNLFYWQSWEIVRRVAQTGGVLLVQMVTDSEEAGIIYAITVSVVALLLHKHHDPFLLQPMDDLQLSILVSQFLTQLGIIACYMLDGDGAQGAVGIVILLVQTAVGFYGQYCKTGGTSIVFLNPESVFEI
eukprot:gene4027-4997_t